MYECECNFKLDNGVEINYVKVFSLNLQEDRCEVQVLLYTSKEICDDKGPEVAPMLLMATDADFENYFSKTALQNKSIYDSLAEYISSYTLFEKPE